MKNSTKRIEVIRPVVFGDEVKAFFTFKNGDYEPNGSTIRGLNLAYNTSEIPEIISKNRKELLHQFGIAPDKIAFADQVHGNNISIVTSGCISKDTDALITQKTGLALAIQAADCAIILVSEPQSQTIAAVHAGWRGAASGIASKTIERMKSLGAVMSFAKAYISPCICVNHFEVGMEVAKQFPKSYVDYKNYSKPHINLKDFLKDRLIKSGVSEKNIEVDDGCTIENEKNFYSYRREKEKSGRMLAVIQMQAAVIPESNKFNGSTLIR